VYEEVGRTGVDTKKKKRKKASAMPIIPWPFFLNSG
jgi:hypothetical protein